MEVQKKEKTLFMIQKKLQTPARLFRDSRLIIYSES